MGEQRAHSIAQYPLREDENQRYGNGDGRDEGEQSRLHVLPLAPAPPLRARP